MTHYDAIASNKQKSILIVGLFVAFVGLVSYIMALGFGFGLDLVADFLNTGLDLSLESLESVINRHDVETDGDGGDSKDD